MFFIAKPKGKAREYFNKPLAEIPIPTATKEQQQPIIDLVDKILVAKSADNSGMDVASSSKQKASSRTATQFSQVSGDKDVTRNRDTTAFERKIDELVYKLYGLTDEEIAIVEGR